MSSAEPAVLRPRPTGPGERLSAATGALAGRLADLLERALPGSDERASGREFLRAMAAAADAPEPWSGDAGDDPLDRLTHGFGLFSPEVDLILLAGLPDEHEGYAGILRTLHPRGEPRPTVGLAAQLLCADAADRRGLRALLEGGSVVRSGALRLGEEGPFFERSLVLGDALWTALHGLDAWPPALEPERDAFADGGLEEWLGGPEAERARAVLAAGLPHTLLVTADTAEIAQQRGGALARAAGVEPVRVTLPPGVPGFERLLSVHATLRGVIPVVRVGAADHAPTHDAPGFGDHPGPVVLCARSGGMAVRGARPVLEVPAERLTPTARRRLWSAALPELGMEAATLAARYTVEPDLAGAAADDARARARSEGRAVSLEDVGHAVRTRARVALSSGVRFIRPAARWDDLVLPPKRMAQLREALDRLVNQGRVLDEWAFLRGRPGARGVRMLFSGGSGTGKTFSAEVMAGELGVDLLLVDISRVVSKWIGETEKNLAEVFDVAERAQAVLLFDEADALFGKRTEVSDAHDRYANLETAFLLTRLERFEGLAILSTNLRQNLDPAFMRRLEFVVDYEEPGPRERSALWRGHLPPAAPLDRDVDIDELSALYPVVGGFIRNAAVAAAFLAAAEGTPITRSHLVRAIRREYEKTGRAFPGLPAGVAAL